MDEILTIEEIEARYAPDWVLIGEPQTDESLRVQAGKVLFHGPDQDESFAGARTTNRSSTSVHPRSFRSAAVVEPRRWIATRLVVRCGGRSSR